MKVGILYISTGKYSVFWENFYKTCEKHFLQNAEKHYYVFTDDSKIQSSDRIVVKFEKPKGFPLDSLLRFDMFLSIEEQLQEMDYLFFFNSNMSFVQDVGEEMLPKNKSGLMGVLHPGYFNKKATQFPYERNKQSGAYIKFKPGKDYHYFMGGLNGGRKQDFLKLSHELSNRIKEDMSKKVMAIYHDESHINAYFNDRDVLILDSSYGFPEDNELGMEPKILILNKIKHAGKYFDKLPTTSYWLRLRKKIARTYSQIIWKYQ